MIYFFINMWNYYVKDVASVLCDFMIHIASVFVWTVVFVYLTIRYNNTVTPVKNMKEDGSKYIKVHEKG